MAKREIKKGAGSKILHLFIRNSSEAGEVVGLTGLAHNTAGLTCYYHRDSAASAVQVALASMSLGQFASGGFKEVDGTNLPGVYQLCLPDAAIADGAESVVVLLQGAANMEVVPLEIELTATDNQNPLIAGIEGTQQTLDDLAEILSPSVVAAQLGTGEHATDLQVARDNIAKQLADMTASPKPTYEVDGQRVDWDAHFRALSSQLESIDLAIQGSQPFEVRTTGYTG